MSLRAAIASYIRVRSFAYFIRNRAALERWQAKRVEKWLRDDVPKVDAFDGPVQSLLDLPIMDKATLMADFSRYTTARISNDQGWAAFNGPKRIGNLTVGASTGTSGNRGLFAISEQERFAWLGAILAKTVPDFWRHRDRVAVLLPIDTPLYDSANHTKRLSLAFFDITEPFDKVARDLQGFDPTLIIAPPRILRRIVQSGITINPRRVFSAAEKLEAIDRTVIDAGFGCPLGEIYMATEGLFATTCRHGRLHLAEDCMHFEFEPAGDGLVMPIISDFSRKTQIMARYRMNDLLRLDKRPCPCGSPLMGLVEVVGREDDVFWLPGKQGGTVELTPDILRNAILDTDRTIDDFRLIQTGERALSLHLPDTCGRAIRQAVENNILALLAKHNCISDIQITTSHLTPHTMGKLRRVRQDWAKDSN